MKIEINIEKFLDPENAYRELEDKFELIKIFGFYFLGASILSFLSVYTQIQSLYNAPFLWGEPFSETSAMLGYQGTPFSNAIRVTANMWKYLILGLFFHYGSSLALSKIFKIRLSYINCMQFTIYSRAWFGILIPAAMLFLSWLKISKFAVPNAILFSGYYPLLLIPLRFMRAQPLSLSYILNPIFLIGFITVWHRYLGLTSHTNKTRAMLFALLS